ncbi:hypothetical protein, partial [Burkholderia orbicola]|uniref:hypothetical protein n=1 Tax=Burkholderia orbicola TaxID=2978683 RepID=UPI002FE32CFD
NRTVKRLYADDSADSRVKVGNRQAPSSQEPPPERRGFLHFSGGNVHGGVKPYQRYCISISPTQSIPASHSLNRFYLQRFNCLLIASSIKTTIFSPQRIDKRDHMISFPLVAARHPYTRPPSRSSKIAAK